MYEQPFNPYIKNLTVVKEYFRTPRVLVIGISQVIGALLSLIAGILITTHIPELLSYARTAFIWFCNQQDFSSSFRDDVVRELDKVSPNTASVYAVSGMIPSFIITCLFATAFILIYFKSRSANPIDSPKAGVIILYVFAIIELIGVILCVIGFAAIIALLFIAYAQGSVTTGKWDLPFSQDYLPFNVDKTILLAVAIAVTVVLVIASFVLLFVAINRMRYYKSIKNSLSTVDLHSEGARPYGVMCIIKAVFLGLSALSMPSSMFVDSPLRAPEFMTGVIILCALSTAVSCVSAVMEGSLALGYKKNIDNAKYGYAAHAVPAAPYAPFNAGMNGFAPQNRQQYNPYKPAAPAPDQDEPDVSSENAYSDPYGEDVSDTDHPEAKTDETATPTCPSCGAEADPDAPFCGNCGNKL